MAAEPGAAVRGSAATAGGMLEGLDGLWVGLWLLRPDAVEGLGLLARTGNRPAMVDTPAAHPRGDEA